MARTVACEDALERESGMRTSTTVSANTLADLAAYACTDCVYGLNDMAVEVQG